ncbi:MAG: LysR family transcriptional regulator [Spongiibacteraceae bacterium]
MSRPPQSTARNSKGPRMRTHLRVMLDDEIAFGPGKADLLEAIRDTGSISAAGKKLGMSYRRAWLLVDAMNRCFKSPLVETAAGGVAGGGAQLSVNGEEVLQKYRALEAAVAKVSDKAFADIKPLLRKTPLDPVG